MPRRQPPRHVRALLSCVRCKAVPKPIELRRQSPSRRVVLLRLPSGWRPVEALVPVRPAAPLCGDNTAMRLHRDPHPPADLPTAAAVPPSILKTAEKRHSATSRLLHS
jgi:hypothetical protein